MRRVRVGAPVPRSLLWFAYDGGAFDGYARQRRGDLRTVEEVLEAAAVERGVADDVRALRLRSGSRTDRGVSARRNACLVDAAVPGDRVAATIGTTVRGLWPLWSHEVDEAFDPRRAVERVYRYHVPHGWVPAGAAGLLRAAGEAFVGTHDFRVFARLERGREPVRTVRAVTVEEHAQGLVVEVCGQSFLWRQVRRMMAAMLAVVRAEAEPDDIARALEVPASAPDWGQAPAGPLVLWDVRYAGLPEPAADAAHGRRLADALADASAALWARSDAASRVLPGSISGP